jgi:hypothetical protein
MAQFVAVRGIQRRVIVRIGTLLALAVALAGCSLLETTESELSFSYRPFGGDDEMDQVLEIVNDGPGAVVPTLEITPLDSASQPIPGLKVTTAYGSERGERVLPPYFADNLIVSVKAYAAR